MHEVTITEITERLRELPHEKLAVVYDFVSFLSDRSVGDLSHALESDTAELLLASEALLGKDWNTAEEDAAWADL